MKLPRTILSVTVALVGALLPADAADVKAIPAASISSPIDWDTVYEPGALLTIIDHIEGLDHPVRVACVAIDPQGRERQKESLFHPTTTPTTLSSLSSHPEAFAANWAH